MFDIAANKLSSQCFCSNLNSIDILYSQFAYYTLCMRLFKLFTCLTLECEEFTIAQDGSIKHIEICICGHSGFTFIYPSYMSKLQFYLSKCTWNIKKVHIIS